MGLLSVVITLPIAGGILVLLSSRSGGGGLRLYRWVGLLASIATFVASIPLWTLFDRGTAEMQFVEQYDWIPMFHVQYFLGVDGFSMPLILLTTFLTPLVLIAAWKSVSLRQAQYFATFLIMEGLMIGVFSALDALLFYIFWEAMLIPMFIIIGVWGGPRRIYATIKFFLYTFLGSMLMLVAVIYLYSQAGSYSILDFHAVPLSLTEQVWIFIAFLAAFAVKVPMWPVHTWLPDAHVEAPTGGSVILAAILLKMGGYGLLRFSLPVVPDASALLAPLVIALSLIAIVYIGLVAMVQTDMKKLIAYSSVAHMGFVTLGIFVAWAIFARTAETAGMAMGMTGGMVQMISHGLVSGALFFCMGVLYDRLHTRKIADYGGVANQMPHFGAFIVLFAMANVGLPGTSGFVGEFLVILSSLQANFWYALLAATALITSAGYTLWMIKRVMFGPVANDRVATMTDLDCREYLVLGILAAGVLLIGVWPAPLVDVLSPTVDNLINQIMQSKL